MKIPHTFLLLLLIFLTACKSKLHFKLDSMKAFESEIPINYLHSDPKENDKTVFFMVEEPDTNNALQKMLLEELHKNNWQIIIPFPSGADFQTQQVLDTRQNRLTTALHIYYELLKQNSIDTSGTLMIMGIKEQGYLVAQLYNALKADKFITVNTGPHNYLHEIEKLQYYEDSSFKNTEEFKSLYLKNLNQINSLMKQIEEGEPLAVSLGRNTNRDWLSYYHHQTSGDFLLGKINGKVLISEDYPFIHNDSKLFFDALLKVNPEENVDIIKMPGTGDYTKEEEREILLDYFKKALNADH